ELSDAVVIDMAIEAWVPVNNEGAITWQSQNGETLFSLESLKDIREEWSVYLYDKIEDNYHDLRTSNELLLAIGDDTESSANDKLTADLTNKVEGVKYPNRPQI